MSIYRFTGLGLHLSGWTREVWGELSGDSLLVARGRRDRLTGKARQVSAIEREQAQRQLAEFQHHHRDWSC